MIQDIRLRAGYQGNFEMPCARCLDPVAQRLEEQFDLLFRPTGVDAAAAEHAISTSDTEIGYYEGGRLAVEDVLREQVLLSLPARALCQQECKGLCPAVDGIATHEVCACDAKPGRCAVDSAGRSPQQDENIKFEAISGCSRTAGENA